MCAAPLFER